MVPVEDGDDLAVVVDKHIVAMQVVVDQHAAPPSAGLIDHGFEPVDRRRQFVAPVADPRVLEVIAQNSLTSRPSSWPAAARRRSRAPAGTSGPAAQDPRSRVSTNERVQRKADAVSRPSVVRTGGTTATRRRELVEQAEVGRRVAPPDLHEPGAVDDEGVGLEPAGVPHDRCRHNPVLALE